jgi:hypothetical protein
MSLIAIPDGIPTFLISQARDVARFGYSVSATPGQTFESGSLGSAVQGSFPSDLLPFLVPIARDLCRWGWDVTDPA